MDRLQPCWRIRRRSRPLSASAPAAIQTHLDRGKIRRLRHETPPSFPTRPRTSAVDHRVPAVLAPPPRRARAPRLRRDCERRSAYDRPACFYRSAEIASAALVAMNQVVRSTPMLGPPTVWRQQARRSRSRQTSRNTTVGHSRSDARILGAIVVRGLTAEVAQGQQAPCDRPPTFAVSPKTKVAATSARCRSR
jgi:hypothetical protein